MSLTRQVIAFALLIGLAGASFDGQIRYRFRLPQPLNPPGPPDTGPPPEVCGDGIDNDGDGRVDENCPVDRGGYRPQIYPSHGGAAVGGCRVGPGGVPRIVRVNSLADTNRLSEALSGSGSANDPFVHTGTLRGALLASWPRCIVFEVSGYITMTTNFNIVSPYLTVAGQTSPAGITIRSQGGTMPTGDHSIISATHDVVFQHIAIRPGDTSCNSGFQTYDFGNPANVMNNVLLDHVSVTWGQDEGISGSATNYMIWRSIVAEMLIEPNFSTGQTVNCTGGGPSGGHGIALVEADGTAILQNLIAHTVERSPMVDNGSSGAIQNNLYYSPGEGFVTGGFHPFGPYAWRFDGNYIKRDANAGGTRNGVRVDNAAVGSQMYLNDNVFDNGTMSPPYTQFQISAGTVDPRVATPPPTTTVSGYAPMTASVTYDYVLARAGPRPLSRDPVDTRIVNTVINRTGSYVLFGGINALGGYPTLPTTTGSYTVPANPFSVAAGQTFRTNMEMDLEAKAAALEPAE